MDAQSGKAEGRELTLRECFDQVLARHMERLIGTSTGIGGLPLNLLNVTSLILLTEQITEEMENFSTPAERYNRSTLFNELCEMEITFDEDTESLLDEMIKKNYVEVDQDGGFSAKKPTIRMVQLLDRVFPNMPGMNLIASLAQTMDEVRGGSKDLESSVSRFDQILKMQGVPLTTEEPAPKSERGGKRSTSGQMTESKTTFRTIIDPAPVELPKKQKLSDIYSIQPGRMPRATPPVPSAVPAPPNATESDALQETPVPEIAPDSGPFPTGRNHEPLEASHDGGRGIDGPPESAVAPIETTSPAFDRDPSEIVPQAEDRIDAPAFQDSEMEDISSTPESPLSTSGLREQDASVEIFGTETRTGTTTPYPEGEDKPQEPEIFSDDQDIEKRIAEFENALALQCPICTTGVVKEETTSTGKRFYKCTAVDCNFLSWGKPFHITCPQCRNPFLVEVTGRDGEPILKCPRATCAHWQKPPSETEDAPGGTPSQPTKKLVRVRRGSGKGKRKVVRRRVVKRKR